MTNRTCAIGLVSLVLLAGCGVGSQDGRKDYLSP